ncbi:hypothetical protein SAMN04488503_2863 [Humidesulfovibrio mexicanus]|uniref:Apea-like HEPN domain-containing protein n=1 Tax=Humidesulfovibrio mexicanus TaxID=147047 RepID=A0A239BYF6_9BACT|nr:hypothetical protein SAMN04488503_2863 [Humidesulfovibrio mexicanus]
MKHKRVIADYDKDTLFGGVAGAGLEPESVEIAPGLILRQTYAHVFGPLLAAFKRPLGPHAPHPAPWMAVGSGTAWDIEIEIELMASSRPTGFDRLNSLWFATALLRLRTGIPLRMPIISPMAFSGIASSQQEPQFLTIETQSTQLRLSKTHRSVVTLDDVEWLRQYYVSGATLVDDEHFGAAFMMFDESVWVSKPRAGLLLAWGAIECAMRPGQRDTAKRLARHIAALLEPRGPNRTRLYQQVKRLYGVRGDVIHAGASVAPDNYFETLELTRRLFLTCFEQSVLPAARDLEGEWKACEAEIHG